MKRILLKLSGEALAGDKKKGFDDEKAKMNTNVAEYLNLKSEIEQIKVQIKESRKGKTTNIIKEYEAALKAAKKFGKAGRMNEYKEAMRVVREKESNGSVQEYKAKKDELTAIREEIENAQKIIQRTIEKQKGKAREKRFQIKKECKIKLPNGSFIFSINT